MSDILAEPPFDWFINLLTFSYQEEKSIITEIQSDTIQIYFINENVLRKKSIFTSIQSTTLPCIILRSFIRHLQSQHPVSTFGFEKVFGSMKRLSAIQKMLVSPADFSTCPVGRALWEESLVLSKIHSSIRADELNFCPLDIFYGEMMLYHFTSE